MDNRERIQKALFKTIRAYNSLIKDPSRNKSKWKYYGKYDSCILCKAIGVNDFGTSYKCNQCPLAIGFNKTPCLNDSLQLLRDSITQKVENRIIVKQATRRLEYVIMATERNGWKTNG